MNGEGFSLALDRLMEDLLPTMRYVTCTITAKIDFVIECMRVSDDSNPLAT